MKQLNSRAPRHPGPRGQVLRDAARVAVTFLGATGAVTLGQVLAKLLTQ